MGGAKLSTESRELWGRKEAERGEATDFFPVLQETEKFSREMNPSDAGSDRREGSPD